MTSISKIAVCRMFRAAIQHALDYNAYDPATMSAVELLADGHDSIEALLGGLWNHPEYLEFDHMSSIGIEHSYRKQAAVLTVTGRSWADWQGFMQVAA